MPSPACRSQTLVQQHESCRPRRPAPSPRVPRSRDGSSVRPRRDPRRTDGCLRRSLLIGQLHPYNRGGHEESHPPVHLSHEPDRWDGVRYLRV